MSEPCDFTAIEARRLIGAKELSPVELLESCISRTELINPSVNAVVTKAYALARADAQKAEQAVMRGDELGILHGLPALIKDLNDTKGIRTTYGSTLYRENIPVDDDPVVARMRAQGAVIFGKTNSPEFGVGSNTRNDLFGPTGNPFDPMLTCGGSSGGAAVALATGMAPIANGSDSGASIRNPAAFCGVSGIRPTPGVVPNHKRVIGLSTNGVHGPMGRTIRDNAMFLAAISAYDSRDMLSTPIDSSGFLSLAPFDISGLRVAFSEDLGFAPVDNVVRETFRRKLSRISHNFAACDAYDVPLKNAEMAYWGMRGLYLLAGSKKHYDRHADVIDPNLRWNIEDAMSWTSSQVASALAEQTRCYVDFQSIFDGYDILVTPAVNVLPFPHAVSYPRILQGRPAKHYSEWYSITYGITLVGHPAVSLPMGLDPQGTPFGVQIVGRRFGDKRLLEISAALEDMLARDTDLCRPVPDLPRLQESSVLVS